ncbi:MAG TPA: tripartite tricarboxylate transporter substrate binding protein [Burkholderiales bacterium]|nr:tripartite tricarboxylate transporter substrate binding protein [Burkholderiales bacterium]
MKLRAALFLLAALVAGPAFSQSSRIIVPFPPGGGADALARLMAPKLSELWKEQVIVENKPGASGHIGADFVARSPADGKTLLMSSTASLTEKNVDQFAPVTLVSASPYVVTAAAKNSFSSIKELIAFARANPGKLTFGSSGTGAASHLSAELFKSMAKVDLLHVPYKGTGQAVTDLLAGQIDLLFAPAQAVLPHVKAGKLKALATTGARRPETIADLPTVAEAGLPGYEAVGWFGLLVPVATPRPMVEKLSADANKVLADRETRARMQAVGADPAGNTPDEFARFIRDDQAKWAKLMREAGIKPEG